LYSDHLAKKVQSALRKGHEISFMFVKRDVSTTSQMWQLRHRRISAAAAQIYKSSDLASLVPV